MIEGERRQNDLWLGKQPYQCADACRPTGPGPQGDGCHCGGKLSILEQTDQVALPWQFRHDALDLVARVLSADLVLLLREAAEQDRWAVVGRSGRVSEELPAQLFAPPGSLLDEVSHGAGLARLRLLPLLGVPGSGQGRGMGTTLACCDGAGSVLLVSRLPHRPAFVGADVTRLRELLHARFPQATPMQRGA